LHATPVQCPEHVTGRVHFVYPDGGIADVFTRQGAELHLMMTPIRLLRVIACVSVLALSATVQMPRPR
jgi:hypothetical protein